MLLTICKNTKEWLASLKCYWKEKERWKFWLDFSSIQWKISRMSIIKQADVILMLGAFVLYKMIHHTYTFIISNCHEKKHVNKMNGRHSKTKHLIRLTCHRIPVICFYDWLPFRNSLFVESVIAFAINCRTRKI